jgi:hypothetical protein
MGPTVPEMGLLLPERLEGLSSNSEQGKPNMYPTKRQIAKTLRQTARIVTKFPRPTNALFEVCKARGSRASAYYDGAVRTIKAYGSFSELLRLPAPEQQKVLRRAARALEHGLHIER